MAYRATERTEARKAHVRFRILAAAQSLVAEDGFRNAPIASVAELAGVATGTVYRYFPSKATLVADVFRTAAQREVDTMAAAAAEAGTARERMARAVRMFASRAVRGRRMAYALIAEPVDPAVEAERLIYRRAYANVLTGIIHGGVRDGQCPTQHAPTTSAFLVGAMAEALVGPLAPEATALADDGDVLIDAIVTLCLRAACNPEADR